MSIQIENVSKGFGQVRALDGVSAVLEENKIYGLLGRNGAGKSTLLNIVTNRLFADSGQVLVDGQRVAENDDALSQIFLTSEKTYYPESMKVKDAFRWTRNFYPSFDEAFALRLAGSFQLNLNGKIRGLSTGYASIFKLVTALSVNTPYVLLDEPVLGLDANHRDLFYRVLLAKYGEKPFTVVLSTHLIEEVSSVLEDVVILKNGRVLCADSQENLLARGYAVSGTSSLVDSYIAGKEVLSVDSLGGLRTAYVLGKVEPGELPQGLELSRLNLQKLFIQLTNEEGEK